MLLQEPGSVIRARLSNRWAFASAASAASPLGLPARKQVASFSLGAFSRGRRVRVRLEGVQCTAAVIHAGGRPFVLPWAPFEADITEGLSDGANQVVVEVIGGRHNIMGPLHTPARPWVGPENFSPHDKTWTQDYLLHDHGLTAVVVEVLR